jgi:hypothetical protein
VDSGSVQSVAKFFTLEDCMQMFLKEEETPLSSSLLETGIEPLTDIRVVLRIHTHDSQDSKNACLYVKHERTAQEPMVLFRVFMRTFKTTRTGNSLKPGCFPPGRGTVGSFGGSKSLREGTGDY